MKLQQQVCSLELAKKLYELGVKQESMFWWYEGTNPATLWNEWSLEEEYPDPVPRLAYSAFTVAELGEMLPPLVELNDHTYELVIDWDNRRGRMLRYERSDGSNFTSEGDTEAEARAKMLVHLLENGLLEAKQ